MALHGCCRIVHIPRGGMVFRGFCRIMQNPRKHGPPQILQNRAYSVAAMRNPREHGLPRIVQNPAYCVAAWSSADFAAECKIRGSMALHEFHTQSCILCCCMVFRGFCSIMQNPRKHGPPRIYAESCIFRGCMVFRGFCSIMHNPRKHGLHATDFFENRA